MPSNTLELPNFKDFKLPEEVDEPTHDEEEPLSGPTANYGAGEQGSEWFENYIPKFRDFLFEQADYSSGTKQFHKQAVRHKYRAGTKVGTVGYHVVGGGFTHVYHHEKNGDEIHIYKNPEGKVDQWTHVSEDGAVHRIGKDFGVFKAHLEARHPETLKEEERIQKEKERERANKAKKNKKKSKR